MEEIKHKKRLGLDLGTSSIGWCLLKCDAEETNYEIIDLGVRMWSTGDLADRRKHRLARRQRRYKKERLRNIKLLLDLALPDDPLYRTSLHPFELRQKALDSRLEPHELRAIIFHIAKNRGFRGSKAEIAELEKKDTKFGEKITQTEKRVSDEARSYSEWVIKNSPHKLRLRNSKDTLPDHYPTRRLIENEFDAISKMQQQYFPNIDWEKLHNHIFFQRDISIPEPSRCSIYSDEKRLRKEDPLAKEFTTLQALNNIKLLRKNDIEERFLTKEELKKALELCKDQKSITPKSLIKSLKLNKDYEVKGDPKPVPCLMAEPIGIIKLSARAINDVLNKFWEGNEHLGAIMRRLADGQSLTFPKQGQLEYYGKALQLTPNFYTRPPCNCQNEKCPHPLPSEEREYGRSPNNILHNSFNQLQKLVNAIIEKYGTIDEISVELIRSEWFSAKNQSDREKENKEIAKRS